MTGRAGRDARETIDPAVVLAFWRAAGPDKWFVKDTTFDAEVTDRFFTVWQAGVEGRLAQWEATPEGALALVIALDQFGAAVVRARQHERRLMLPPKGGSYGGEICSFRL